MKSKTFILFHVVALAVMVFYGQVAQANILRVNNVPNMGANYATIAAAVAAAQAGDTIHIEGSVTPYAGDVVVDKKLVIIGPGYFLTAPLSGTQHYKESAKINCHITFVAGSGGSILAGIEHRTGATGYTVDTRTANYAGNRVRIQTDSISIISCKLFFVEIDASQNRQNISVLRCFFNPGLIMTTGGSATITNMTIGNCFFRNDFGTAPIRVVISCAPAAPANWRISQCTFYNGFVLAGLSNTLFSSNAFFGVAGNSVAAGINNIFSQNVTNVDGIGISTADNNALRTDGITSWFSQGGNNEAIDVYFTESGNTSSCALYINSESMRGMYGGANPYKEAGMFTIPSVYEIRMEVEVGDSFDMTIRARTHY